MRALFLTLLILSATKAAATDAKPPRLADLRWLTGSWCSESDHGSQEEHWIAPRGGVLLGVHRDTRASGGVFFEFLRIQEEDGTISYLASPAGREPTPFRLVEASDGRVVFENPQHDFPQRIIYERTDNRLEARIEGEVEGETRGSTWVWSSDGCGFLDAD